MPNDETRFHGLAVVFGEVDREGDLVTRGAFRKTVRRRPLVPVLWSHDIRSPVGFGRLRSGTDGLEVRGKISAETRRGRETLAVMRQGEDMGYPIGLSIGYDVKEKEFDRSAGVRRLTELDVREVSLTPFFTWKEAPEHRASPSPFRCCCSLAERVPVEGPLG